MVERNHCVVSWGLPSRRKKVASCHPQANPQGLSNNLFLSPGCDAEAEVLGAAALEVFRFSVQTKLGWQIVLKTY